MLSLLVVAMALFPILGVRSGSSSELSTGITGRVVRVGGGPIAGATIALYERRSGAFLEMTDSLNDGRFVLSAPPSGSYFVVFTKGETSARRDFNYDSGSGGQYLDLRLGGGAGGWARLVGVTAAFLRSTLGAIIAFMLGFYLRQWESRRGSRKILNREMLQLRILARTLNHDLTRGRQALKAPITAEGYNALLARIQPQVTAIEAELAKGALRDAAFEVAGRPGSEWQTDYGSLVQQMERILDTPGGIGSGAAAQRLSDLSSLADELDKRSIDPKLRRVWWHKTASTS